MLESEVLAEYACSRESLTLRYKVMHKAKRCIHHALGDRRFKVFEYGSFPLKTYTLGGDIDLTIVMPASFQTTSEAILQQVQEHFTWLQETQPNLALQDVRMVRAAVHVFKFKLLGVQVDLTVNQIGGLRTLYFLESVNRLVPNHFVKRSIVICKVWAIYFARILGSANGLLATYALEVLVLHTINTTPGLETPFQVLRALICMIADTDWKVATVNIHGNSPASSQLISESFVAGFEPKRNVRPADRKHMNILDPLDSANNLGRSVTWTNAVCIVAACAYFKKRLEKCEPHHLFSPPSLAPWAQDTVAAPAASKPGLLQDYDYSLLSCRTYRLACNLRIAQALVNK